MRAKIAGELKGIVVATDPLTPAGVKNQADHMQSKRQLEARRVSRESQVLFRPGLQYVRASFRAYRLAVTFD